MQKSRTYIKKRKLICCDIWNFHYETDCIKQSSLNRDRGESRDTGMSRETDKQWQRDGEEDDKTKKSNMGGCRGRGGGCCEKRERNTPAYTNSGIRCRHRRVDLGIYTEKRRPF